MNILRKTLAFLLASVVLTFTLPALAASGTKYVSFQFPAIIPSPVAGVVTLDVPFTNDSTPPGVSTINSLQISVSGQNGVCIDELFFTDRSASPSPVPGCVPTVTLTNFTGIRRGETVVLRLTLNNVANATCTPLTWQASANAGNSLNGDQFLDSPTNPSQLKSRAGCDGVLSCVGFETPGADSLFTGSVNATNETQPGFFQGNRYDKGDGCPLLAYYRTTNTIGNTPTSVTVDGYTLPRNFAFIGYGFDDSSDSILLEHTITFAPVWSNTQGLFDPIRIKYCKKVSGGDCTPTSPIPNPNLFVAQGCLSPTIAISSIPGAEPGCLRNWYTYVQDVTNSTGGTWTAGTKYCGGKAQPAWESGQTRDRTCMKVSIDVIEGQDPPWGMTDE